MSFPTLDWGTIVQAGCGGVALYLAIQIKSILKNHEERITNLEAGFKRGNTRYRRRKR